VLTAGGQQLVLLAIALLTCSMLAFEVLQTITLSLQVFHHNAFLVISISMLGLGAGGSVAILLRRLRPTLDPLRAMQTCAFGDGLGALLCMVPASRTPAVAPQIVLTVVPYTFVGLFLSILFKSWPREAALLAHLGSMPAEAGREGDPALPGQGSTAHE
jgi:hypothetical protein